MLYATAEGNYEFYRNGRLVWKRPATLGRNEVSYLDLPGGYYPLEIRRSTATATCSTAKRGTSTT